jgi:hypothetical protein
VTASDQVASQTAATESPAQRVFSDGSIMKVCEPLIQKRCKACRDASLRLLCVLLGTKRSHAERDACETGRRNGTKRRAPNYCPRSYPSQTSNRGIPIDGKLVRVVGKAEGSIIVALWSEIAVKILLKYCPTARCDA